MSGPYQDLLKDNSASFEDGNYFIITIDDLDPNRTYPIQFRWKYKDGSFGKEWSAVKQITTPGESAPNTPAFVAGDVDVSQPEKIIITYRGLSDDATPVAITDIDRVDIYINGVPFDGSKPTDSFKEAGTKIIPAPAGTYIVALYAISKLGTKSPVSASVTKTVIAATTPVEPPTLPSGLSVAAAPFAVSVNWAGTYSSSDFDGFKSIDIHVRGSDVGSTATSGFSTTTQVATLTVTGTTNRQNIGLDNLRQALSLANNQAAYTSPMFFYYIARNVNDALYSVGGTPTYTRINSTSVNPTQANFVDLVNGIISIENLVAGNGKFTSWLRTGGTYVNGVFQGGTRIELSSVNDFPDPTNASYNILKGLTAYNSGNTKIFDLDLDAGTLTIEGSGKFTGDLEAGSGSSIFKSDSSGIYLGNASYASAPFSVSRSGVIKAESGTIGGWTLASTYLQGNNIRLDTNQIIVGSTAQPYFDISPTALTHRNANGTASGKFTLTLGASSQLTIDGALTINGSSIATSGDLSTGLSGKVSNGQVSNDISFTANNIVYKINGNTNTTTIDGGKITTGTVVAGSVVAGWVYAGNISANQINAGTLSANYISGGTISGVTANFTVGNIGGWSIGSSSFLTNNSDVWLHPATGYSTGGQSSTNFSIITTRGISGSKLQAIDTSSTSIQSAGGISVSGDVASGGNIAATSGTISAGSTSATSISTLGGIQASGIIVALNDIRALNATNNADLTGNRLRVVGDSATSGTGTIFANYLGTGTGTAIVQTSGGFLRVSSSSQRYKENIQEINKNGYLNLIAQLRPVTFNYKEEFAPDDYMVVSSGLIAEEVDQIEQLKTIVNYNKDNQPESVSYDRLSALLVLAIQEIKDKMESIEQRLDALEG